MRTSYRPTRCADGRLMRHDPQPDDPSLETDVGTCPKCEGRGCDVCEFCGGKLTAGECAPCENARTAGEEFTAKHGMPWDRPKEG